MDHDLKELQADLSELDAEFAEMDMDVAELEEASSEFDELDAEFSAAGLDDEGGSVSGLSTLAESDADVAFLGGFLKRKVKKLLQKLFRLVRRYGRRCAKCVPLLRRAVRLFRAGRYAAALRAAYAAYRCIKKCIG